jgi:hypothetical protein
MTNPAVDFRSAESQKADGAVVSLIVLEENSPAQIELTARFCGLKCGRRTQERGDGAVVRSVFGWSTIIVFDWDNIISTSASAKAFGLLSKLASMFAEDLRCGIVATFSASSKSTTVMERVPCANRAIWYTQVL